MRKLILRIGLIAGLLFLLGAADPRFAFAGVRTYFETSSVVATSTGPTATQLIAGSSGTDGDTCITFLWGGTGTFPNGEFLALDSDSTVSTNTTSGNFRMSAGQSTEDTICFENYTGPIWGIAGGTNTVRPVNVLRRR
mgnify:CR=1 FL=1